MHFLASPDYAEWAILDLSLMRDSRVETPKAGLYT